MLEIEQCLNITSIKKSLYSPICFSNIYIGKVIDNAFSYACLQCYYSSFIKAAENEEVAKFTLKSPPKGKNETSEEFDAKLVCINSYQICRGCKIIISYR